MLKGLNISLLVGGSIAAYKAAELVREFKKAGANVRVAMSQAATEFITPLTLQTLSGNRVTTDMFDAQQEGTIGHLSLALETDLVIAAPASANTIAKAAHGIADNIVTAVLLATRAPILIAPAMNCNMWENPITQENVARLAARGVTFVGPDAGELACGVVGKGRLVELGRIVEAAEAAISRKDLAGSHVIVTAGPTREAVDPVKYLSTRSTGKMGYAIAKSAARRGAVVTLIAGPTTLPDPFGVTVIRASSALEMRDALLEQVAALPGGAGRTVDFVFMVAAVCDYRPAEIAGEKLKSDKSKGSTLQLAPNPDVIAELGAKRAEFEKQKGIPLKLVGFCAETGSFEQLIDSAKGKIQRKKLDLIAANFVADGFEKDTNRVWLIDTSGRQEAIMPNSKQQVADRIVSAAIELAR